jgi:hypothetical protein
MPPRVVVMVAAWLEIVVGVLFITALDTMCRLLFAAGPEGAGMPLGRLVGVALFALGVASFPTTSGESSRTVVMSLFAYNLGATTLFAWTAVFHDATRFYALARCHPACHRCGRVAATTSGQEASSYASRRTNAGTLA